MFTLGLASYKIVLRKSSNYVQFCARLQQAYKDARYQGNFLKTAKAIVLRRVSIEPEVSDNA